MQITQVWNDGDKEYRESYKGKMISIPAGECIEMNVFEAAEFVAQFVPPEKDRHGRVINPKPLRKVHLKEISDDALEEATASKGYCILCNKDFGTKGLLAVHVKKEHAQYVAMQAKEDDNNELRGTGKSSKAKL